MNKFFLKNKIGATNFISFFDFKKKLFFDDFGGIPKTL